jgi:hypothetical protein
MILPISASQVARIIGMGHWLLAGRNFLQPLPPWCSLTGCSLGLLSTYSRAPGLHLLFIVTCRLTSFLSLFSCILFFSPYDIFLFTFPHVALCFPAPHLFYWGFFWWNISFWKRVHWTFFWKLCIRKCLYSNTQMIV